MCGILGIIGQDDIAGTLLEGLTSIQHRGQDAAGIVTFNHRFHLHKGDGLVSQAFKKVDLERFRGACGLGHVRYATQGSTDVLDAQPTVVMYPFGLAMVHNGNVVNFNQLKQTLCEDAHRLLDTSNDVALILYALAAALETKNLKTLTPDDIFDSVQAVQEKVQGAYSALTIIAGHGLLAFTDPHGIRPLVLGRKYTDKGLVYAFASETDCFDYLGFELIRDLRPGEAVLIDNEGNLHSRVCRAEKQAFCIFEYIYFAREDSVINGRAVATERMRIGRQLAEQVKKAGLQPDLVIDVPSSAYFFAAGMAEALGVPYRRGLAKNNHVGRSFIVPTQARREKIVRQKLNPLKDVVRGKKVAVVDDSIVRGTTSKHIVKLLRESGAAEIYFISAAPPITCPCIYGIDMSVKREIIAAHYTPKQISRYLEADAVIYQSLDDLRVLYHDLPCCYACFSGEYPTGASAAMVKQIEEEKECSTRN